MLRTVFEAHHTRVELIAQAYPELNALAVLGETTVNAGEECLPYILELLARANKPLILGGFEYDIERGRVVFRVSNIFEREKYDADIVSSMVHCAIAETDRITPYVSIVAGTPADLLPDLDLARLLMREDVLPPVPGGEEEEY